MKKEIPKTELLHDSVGVSLRLPDDCIDLTLEELETLHAELGARVQELKTYVPLGPKPYALSGHDDERSKKFLESGPKPGPEDGWKSYFYVGGYECAIKDLVPMRDWLNSAIKYYEVES